MNREEIVKRASRMKPPEPTFDFGKWKGKTVDYVLNQDPGYIDWFASNVPRGKWPKTLDRKIISEARKQVDFAEAESDQEWEDMFEKDFPIFHDF